MAERRRLLIIGAGGRLGAALVRECAAEFDVAGFSHAQLDIGDAASVRECVGAMRFDCMINCAAQTNVDRCETEREEAFALNAEAPRVLAEMCAAKSAKLIHISTDYVFDGDKTEPYSETDAPRPISVYGESKLEGERAVLEVGSRNVVARVSWVFGPDRPSFIDAVIRRARDEENVEAVADKFSAPTYTLDLAGMLRPFIAEEKLSGLFHLSNSGACSWQAYAQWAIDCCRAQGLAMKASHVGATSLGEMKGFVARRPVYTVLSSEKFSALTKVIPRSWQDAVQEYVRTHYANA